MPQPSASLSAFARRDTFDKVLFGFVQGMRRGVKLALPGVKEERVTEHVTVEVAIRAFAAQFDLPPHEFNVESQRIRFGRMEKEWHEDQRTKEAAPAHGH